MEDESKTPLPEDHQDISMVRQLLAVKRYEKPDDAYFDSFLTEFQTRQRSEMLSQSARGLLMERVGTWWWSVGGKKWVYGAGAATAAIAMGVAFRPNAADKPAISENSQPPAFEMNLQLPSPSESDLRPPAMPSRVSKYGLIPVSASSLQEL